MKAFAGAVNNGMVKKCVSQPQRMSATLTTRPSLKSLCPMSDLFATNVPAHKIDSASLAALPRSSGVYIFKGDGTLPLYIGKSVDIRSRVMSHLRTPDEASMVAQTRRIDFIETAGEIGALLLESHMIKEQSPLFNQRLRRIKTLCAIRVNQTAQGAVPEIVDSKSVHLGSTPELYGLFSSVHSANAKLKDLAQQHLLCMSVLGLEKTSQRGPPYADAPRPGLEPRTYGLTENSVI